MELSKMLSHILTCPRIRSSTISCSWEFSWTITRRHVPSYSHPSVFVCIYKIYWYHFKLFNVYTEVSGWWEQDQQLRLVCEDFVNHMGRWRTILEVDYRRGEKVCIHTYLRIYSLVRLEGRKRAKNQVLLSSNSIWWSSPRVLAGQIGALQARDCGPERKWGLKFGSKKRLWGLERTDTWIDLVVRIPDFLDWTHSWNFIL